MGGNDEYYWDWPRHRIPVKILGWYEEDGNNCDGLLGLRPPAQGTFSSLKDNTSETFKKMSIWENFSKKKIESQWMRTCQKLIASLMFLKISSKLFFMDLPEPAKHIRRSAWLPS